MSPSVGARSGAGRGAPLDHSGARAETVPARRGTAGRDDRRAPGSGLRCALAGRDADAPRGGTSARGGVGMNGYECMGEALIWLHKAIIDARFSNDPALVDIAQRARDAVDSAQDDWMR